MDEMYIRIPHVTEVHFQLSVVYSLSPEFNIAFLINGQCLN